MHHYVRLERVHVNEAERPGVLTLSGKVTGRDYYGLYIKYYIDVCGQQLKVIERNDGVRIYETGESVRVNIDPADLMSYRAETEEAHA